MLKAIESSECVGDSEKARLGNSTLVAKTREATVPTATWGRLDTNIMKMWLCSVLKDENLDPLVELVIPLICIHSISLVGL